MSELKEISLFVALWFGGAVVAALFLIQALSLLFFGIPFLQRLSRFGALLDRRPLRGSIAIAALQFLIFVACSAAMQSYLSYYSAGYWMGVGVALVLLFTLCGENETNVRRYLRRSGRYLDPDFERSPEFAELDAFLSRHGIRWGDYADGKVSGRRAVAARLPAEDFDGLHVLAAKTQPRGTVSRYRDMPGRGPAGAGSREVPRFDPGKTFANAVTRQRSRADGSRSTLAPSMRRHDAVATRQRHVIQPEKRPMHELPSDIWAVRLFWFLIACGSIVLLVGYQAGWKF